MQAVLKTYPLATVALGRSLVGCLLMASHQKEGHTVGLYFRGNGPLGVVFAEASYDGAARAHTSQPQLELPLKNGLLDVGGAIGIGLLDVVRIGSDSQKPHSGTVMIKTGEIGDDIAYYLQQSQQIPSAVVLGVEVDEYGKVKGAGGLLVELFPGAPDNVITGIEANLKSAGSVSKMISGGASPETLAACFLKGFALEEFKHESRVRYECRCNIDRVKNALVLLGPEEIHDMIQSKKGIDAKCDFCGRRYAVSLDELKALKSQSVRRSFH